MGISGQSTFVRDLDESILHSETEWRGSRERAHAMVGFESAGQAPGHGPGVGASRSSSTLVSNSLKPRRR